ncbi:MAG: serine hydrolase domain-containing protein, partial [Pseudohongiellaceae bacterium]
MSSLAYSLLLRRLILRLVGACLIVSLFSSAAADESFRARTFNYDFTDYVEWLDSLLRENEIPGAALAIVSREGIMHLQTWGVREVDQRAPVTTDSIFRIASMSKTFAGAAATLLVEQDLQNWETRISDLFPDLRLGNGVSYRSITLKQVASHSTGLMPHSYSNLLDDGIGYER